MTANKQTDATAPVGTNDASPLTVLQRFRVIIRAAQKHSQWIEKQSGISGAQLWALQELSETDGLRIGELAERMALHQSTASNLLDRLEQMGLVRRERNHRDQRIVHVSLTPEGLKKLNSSPSPSRGLLPEALRQLAHEDLALLQKQLDRLLIEAKHLDDGFGMLPIPFAE